MLLCKQCLTLATCTVITINLALCLFQLFEPAESWSFKGKKIIDQGRNLAVITHPTPGLTLPRLFQVHIESNTDDIILF